MRTLRDLCQHFGSADQSSRTFTRADAAAVVEGFGLSDEDTVGVWATLDGAFDHLGTRTNDAGEPVLYGTALAYVVRKVL